MVKPHQNVISSYLKYKENLLGYYSALLSKENRLSVAQLIAKLRDIEIQHKDIMLSNKVAEGNLGEGICEHMALTPINELPTVSKILDEVMEFRQECLNHFLKDLDNDVNEESRKLVTKIKESEIKLQNDLKVERQSCRI